MPAKINLKDKTFGRLTVLEETTRRDKCGSIYWKCQCSCVAKTIVYVVGSQLQNKRIQGCGCIGVEARAKANTKHGHLRNNNRPKLYSIWVSMRQRCLNPNCVAYKNYGGRGIKICNEWAVYEEFEKWSVNNGYKKGLQLDRYPNNDGDYMPDNCRWVSHKLNQRNKRGNRLLTYNNETHCVAYWCEEYGITRAVLLNRLKKGWSMEHALTHVEEV